MKLGILGGGQLARMLALAAHPLGISTLSLDANPKACAGDVTDLIVAEFTDKSALRQFLDNVDCVTYETENIPLSCVEFILKARPLFPSINALEIAQDRFHEKSFFKSLHIPTPAFVSVDSEEELTCAVSDLGLPSVLKTRRFGYDGKGQYVLHSLSDIPKSWHFLQAQSLILEKFISYECELSLIAVRNKHGATHCYPLTKNHHVKGILHSSEAPFHNVALYQEAQRYAIRILDALQYVGVMTIEYFYDGNKLIANEMAPRVHNSGHWTIDGACTSQFENHLRAVYDLPLGSTEISDHCFLLNCIGEMLPVESCLGITGVHYHSYGKSPRPGRKVGHVTLVDTDLVRYQKSKQALLKLASNHRKENANGNNQ